MLIEGIDRHLTAGVFCIYDQTTGKIYIYMKVMNMSVGPRKKSCKSSVK